MMNIIERAFELAAESGSVEEVKRKLANEGYLQVHAHLAGKQIRHEVLGRLNPQLVVYRQESKGRTCAEAPAMVRSLANR